MATVLIIGGGFAGLHAAKGLAGKPGVQVMLWDRRNHHLFQPLLYQVATAGLNPGDIAVPIRAQFSGAGNVEVRLARADWVDLGARLLGGEAGGAGYDYLVLACGSRPYYFGHPEWASLAPGLGNLAQATELRRRILGCFEQAEAEPTLERQRELMSFAVIGGGPTGVELAGAIADIARSVLRPDFRRIDPAHAEVVLVEAGPRILPAFPEALSARATRDLRALGVQVLCGTQLDAITPLRLTLNGQPRPYGAAFWAAGVRPALPEFRGIPPATGRGGRLLVSQDCSLPGHPEAFALGDLAHFVTPSGAPLPGVAPVALQQGRHAARAILADLAGRPRPAFRYRDRGMMAAIGRSRAVAQLGRLQLAGRPAWWAWLLVHIFYLVGFKNRLAVLLQWIWSYLFSRRGTRLIMERD